MEQKTGNSTLPKWCHTVLPQDGSLVIVTYGDSGYRSSPFESGNREENRRIADRENRKLGKISLQQEKTMLAGALLGWEPLADMEQISEENEPWEILVVREDVNGITKGSVVEMPAIQYEIYDALDRAYLPSEEKDIQVEIREGGLPILDGRIDPHTDIFELNNFIQRYFKLDENEKKCYQGQLEMEFQKMGEKQKIPIDKLINLSGSVGSCELLENIHTDYQLGKYCVENHLIKEVETLPEVLLDMLDYESLGRKERQLKGGTFTEYGYMTRNEYVHDIYSAKAIPKERPDYMIRLLIDHEKGKQSALNLPAFEENVAKAYVELGLENYEELADCEFSVEDCVIPWTKKLMNDELYQSDSFGIINEFAKQMTKLSREGKLLTYKAMLEETPADTTLEEIIDLSHQVDKFTLIQTMKCSSDYAIESLAEKGVDIKDTLLSRQQLMDYGESVLAEKGIVQTDFGDLVSRTGETILECMGRGNQGMTMEF